jgi:hypothetical protein
MGWESQLTHIKCIHNFNLNKLCNRMNSLYVYVNVDSTNYFKI